MLYDHPNGEQYLNTTEADNSYVIHFRVTQHGTFIFIRPNNLSRGASSYVALSRNTTRFPSGISTLIFQLNVGVLSVETPHLPGLISEDRHEESVFSVAGFVLVSIQFIA